MTSMFLRLALGLLSLRFSISISNDGSTLLTMKESFTNGDMVLHDWRDLTDNSFMEYCSWTGVTCDSRTVLTLNLKGLDLGGKIPQEIRYLEGLINIDLSSNNLYGQIPSSISELTLLQTLDLHDNNLTGPIPSSLWQMPNLQKMDLHQNKLTGEIPRQLHMNNILEHVSLEHNNLEGPLSPDMCLLTGLQYLGLANNNLSGSIPPEIGNCNTMEYLDLSHNQLSGEIPSSICFLQVITLALNNNKLSGAIPSSIGLMYNLLYLNLGNNQLNGSIPSILGNMQNLTYLHLQENNLTSVIPPELGNMTMLTTLELTANQLTGSIPSELGKLQNLSHLRLADNNLDGSLPENLSSCASLIGIDAHGNNLNGTILPAFMKLLTMAYLNLSSNKLSGQISAELGHIVNLDTIDLSSNEFSGSIPSSIGALHHLLKLNLSNNHLSGLIPMEFGNLRSIMEIDLSFNNLSGRIPQELGLLQSLVLLQVENNKLWGDLLPLTDCFSLSILNVSYNNFVGFVPVVKNFSRFSAESFMRNPGLCGSWNTSSHCHLASLHQHRGHGHIASIIIGFISFACVIAVSLVLIGAYFAFRRYRLHKLANSTRPELIICNANLVGYVYEDIMRMTDRLSRDRKVGRGASCVVYKCIIPGQKPIAIKKLNSRPHDLTLFKTELEIVSNINHRNLVSLHGYSLSPSSSWLIYEYMENGSLSSLLHEPGRLDWDARLKIAIGAARGLEYLHHDCNPKIIHRDVKPANILIDTDGEARIADFGIAKCVHISRTHTSTFVMGTLGYIDPEYAQTTRLTEKSDVFSFGVVLLVLLTGRKAFHKGLNLHELIQERIANNVTTVTDILDPTIASTCNGLEVKMVFRLALQCTESRSTDRPSMREVSRVFERIVRACSYSTPNFDPGASTSNNGISN